MAFCAHCLVVVVAIESSWAAHAEAIAIAVFADA